MKINRQNKIFLAVLCIAVMFSGCTDSLTTLEIENAWTEALVEGGVDYKGFCDPAKQAIYSLRSDDMGDVLSAKDINLIKKALSYTDATAMETDALLNAMMEDTFIVAGITEAYSNAETINYAVKTYCDKCYEKKKVVKSGKISIKLSAKASSGKVRYNGKTSDLKKFLNKYLHPEARNGYCEIEINDYNSPVSVVWSAEKIKKAKNDEITSSWNIIEISEGKTITGKYPSSFWVSNTLTEKTIAKTSLASSLGDYQATMIKSEDMSELQDMLVEIYRSDIDNSINLDELGVEGANIEIINGIGSNFNGGATSERRSSITIDTANANAKLAYTNAATWCTKCEVSGNSVRNGWYYADLSKNNADNALYDASQNDFEKALGYLMSNITDYGYVCVYFKNQSPEKAYFTDKDILSNIGLNSLPDKLICENNNIIGAYPYESQLGNSANFSLVDSESMMVTANSNAKLVYTNAAIYATKTEVNGYSIPDGWYKANLNEYNSSDLDYNPDGTQLEKALISLMGSDRGSAGYACVYIKNSVPNKAYYCRKDVFNSIDLDSLPETLSCTDRYIIGAYPNESRIGSNANFIVNAS